MPKTSERQREIENVMKSIDEKRSWIGLQRIGNQFYWLDGDPSTYFNWDDDEPSSDITDKYAFLNKRNPYYPWRLGSSSRDEPFLCWRLNTAYGCPAGWTRLTDGRVCYGEQTLSGQTEQEMCSVQTAATVAMPKILLEDVYLTQLMQDNGIDNLTLGLSYTADDWYWDDGTKLVTSNDSYVNWASASILGPPPSALPCVIKSKSDNYSWIKSDCTPQNTVVCECYLPFVGETLKSGVTYCPDGESITTPDTTAQYGTSQADVTTSVEPTSPESPTAAEYDSTSLADVVTTSVEYTSPESTTYHMSTETSTKTNTISNAPQNSSTESVTTSPRVCTCIHPPCQAPINVTLEDKIKYIKANLTVDIATLSSTVRKLTCADDQRPSSTYIGLCGGVVLGVIGFILLVLDLLPIK
jgi:hypothetical protein